MVYNRMKIAQICAAQCDYPLTWETKKKKSKYFMHKSNFSIQFRIYTQFRMFNSVSYCKRLVRLHCKIAFITSIQYNTPYGIFGMKNNVLQIT